MNIFYLSHCPEYAAKLQCDKHVVKMILETAQMLSTAHHELGSDYSEVVYKSTHKNHPSAVWLRSNTENYTWAYQHFMALCREYTHRYGKTHLSETKLAKILCHYPDDLPYGTFTFPPKCMPDDYKDSSKSPINSYQAYYRATKRSFAKYTNRACPGFMT